MEYTEIPLGRSGKTKTKIDAEDQERLTGQKITWCHHPLGYAYRQIRIDGKKKTIYLHREVLGLKEGDGSVVDHIDGDKLNNTKSNLRWAKSRAEGLALNNQNRPSYKGASSSYRGVSKRGDKWEVSVQVRGKKHYVGAFSSEITAAIAAQVKREEVLEWNSTDPRLDDVKLDTQQVQELRTSFPRSKSRFSASSRGTTKRSASKTIGAPRRSSGKS
jgi:hypothetical protein